jgi:hypothetical protein
MINVCWERYTQLNSHVIQCIRALNYYMVAGKVWMKVSWWSICKTLAPRATGMGGSGDLLKGKNKVRYRCLMPVILGMWETEIGKTMVQGQSYTKNSQDPISTSSWAQAYMPVIPDLQNAIWEYYSSRPIKAKNTSWDPYHLNRKCCGGAHASHASYVESINRKIRVQFKQGKSKILYRK